MQKNRFQFLKLFSALFLTAFGFVLAVPAGHAETPVEFARKFAKFKFVFHAEVQPPEVFLATKSGDCDDFATLAAETLGKSGYETRLFAIRMEGQTHVICYVPAAKAYLDYNNRAAKNPLVASDGSLQDIASKVARSFKCNWIAGYEFAYHHKTKWLVNNVVFNETMSFASR